MVHKGFTNAVLVDSCLWKCVIVELMSTTILPEPNSLGPPLTREFEFFQWMAGVETHILTEGCKMCYAVNIP